MMNHVITPDSNPQNDEASVSSYSPTPRLKKPTLWFNKMKSEPRVVIEHPSPEAVDTFIERAAWGNKFEFILTVVGMAVGLGNIWRFPYLCYRNGGGAFLIPYFGSLFLVGIPIFMLELAVGQFVGLGPIAMWTLNPLLKGLGISFVVMNTIVCIYYNVIIAWIAHYLFASMNSKLPWQDCNNHWNTEQCCVFENMNIDNSTDGSFNTSSNATSNCLRSPAEEYYYNEVLQVSSGTEYPGTIVWRLALCLLFCWLVTFLVLIKGISSLGKVVYFSTIFPYVLLTVMLVRGVTLDGAREGVIYYLKPDFKKLAVASTWSDAATQIFYSLGICTGGMTTMASFNPFHNNVLRDALLVPIINCLTSFYGGFAIFSVLGYMAKQKGVPIDKVAEQGAGLIFIVYPEALTKLPVAPLWSVLFFLMMITLGFSSLFSMTEVTLSSIIDEFPILRKTRWHNILTRGIGCLLFYILGLILVTKGGFFYLNMVDYYLGGIPLLFVGMLEFVAIIYIYGYSNFAYDIEMMLGRKVPLCFKVAWLFVSPVLLLVVTVAVFAQLQIPIIKDKPIPSAAVIIGWLFVSLTLCPIPIWFFYYFGRHGGWKLLKNLSRASEAWGPALNINRTGKYAVTPPGMELTQDGGEEETQGRISEGQISEGQISEGQISEGRISEGRISEGRIIDGRIRDRSNRVSVSNIWISSNNNNNNGRINMGRDNEAFDKF